MQKVNTHKYAEMHSTEQCIKYTLLKNAENTLLNLQKVHSTELCRKYTVMNSAENIPC